MPWVWSLASSLACSCTKASTRDAPCRRWPEDCGYRKIAGFLFSGRGWAENRAGPGYIERNARNQRQAARPPRARTPGGGDRTRRRADWLRGLPRRERRGVALADAAGPRPRQRGRAELVSSARTRRSPTESIRGPLRAHSRRRERRLGLPSRGLLLRSAR